MITAIRPGNQDDYKALYEEASDLLSGYKRVRTYDSDAPEYFYKTIGAATVEELYKKEDTITDLLSFSRALAIHKVLYVKDDTNKADEFNPLVGITTLEEYFNWLKDLGNANRKYTVLPLDEEHFEINADTRIITIPASFKKNGIAVQGDDLAEVVYFKVDRYYDYMDLNNTDIYIQWETPKPAGGGESVKSLSPAYIRDIESEPGKLIFGWALDKSITQNPGTLKFSVRFFQWEDPQKAENGADTVLAYSLSTLTASVSINAALNFNIASMPKVEDTGVRLLARLKNSVIAGGYSAAEPIFEVNLDDTIKYDLDEETGTYKLLVQAYATDTGSISYSWYQKELDDDNSTKKQNINPVDSTNVYVEVEDVNNLEKAYAYYWTKGGDELGNPVYIRFTDFIRNADGTNTPDPEILKDKKLYTRQSECIVNMVGSYYAVAENRITNSVTPKESAEAMFPRPEKVAATEPAEQGWLEKVEDGVFECPLSVIASNEDGYLTYKWQYNANHTSVFDKDAEEENFKDETGDLRDNNTFIATKPGRYRVIITNHRNKDFKFKTSTPSRVTHYPDEPVLATLTEAERHFQIEDLETKAPTITIIPEGIDSDSYVVQWFHEDIDEYIKEETLPRGTYTSSFNPNDPLYRNMIVENTSDGDIDGSYYAIVTNIVNGKAKSTEKPEFNNMFTIV